MGCWNGTCGLSGLPILQGTEIYVFPIVEAYRDSFCYSTALYRPSVLPFRAEYNDYGAGENCKGVGLDLLMEGIRNRLIEMDVGENEHHDIAVKRDGFDVEQFFEACHEKRLQFKNPLAHYPGEKPAKDVFFTMIRRDIADRLWNEWSFDLWKPSALKEIPAGFEADKYYIKGVTYAKLAELIPDYMEKQFDVFREEVDKLKAGVGDDETAKKILPALIEREMQSFFETPYKSREHLLAGTAEHMFSTGYSDGGFSRISSVKEAILLKFICGEKEAAYELLRECLVGYMINSFMESTRKVWLPPMHQGSQSEQLDEYRLLNAIVEDVITERLKEYED
jgi:hypothetical protein